MMRLEIKTTAIIALLFTLSVRCADEPTGAAEKVDAGAKVTFSNLGRAGEIELPPALARLFIEMLARPSYKSHISRMPAAPLGVFKAEGKSYLWHGNAVITGDGDNERLWSGPLTQRMVRDGENVWSAKPEDLKKYFEKLAADPDLSKTKVEGPGAYPGGGDALHPLPSGDGLKEFKPQDDKKTESNKETK